MDWLTKKVGKVGAELLVLAVVILACLAMFFGVKRYFTKDLTAQVAVGKNQTSAAVESGHEAVETVGSRAASEASGAQTVKESQDEINRASDPGSVTDAGLSGLHRVRGQAGAGTRR